jgi:hypothetical protein
MPRPRSMAKNCLQFAIEPPSRWLEPLSLSLPLHPWHCMIDGAILGLSFQFPAMFSHLMLSRSWPESSKLIRARKDSYGIVARGSGSAMLRGACSRCQRKLSSQRLNFDFPNQCFVPLRAFLPGYCSYHPVTHGKPCRIKGYWRSRFYLYLAILLVNSMSVKRSDKYLLMGTSS